MQAHELIAAMELTKRRDRRRSEWRSVWIALSLLIVGLCIWVVKFNW